MELINKKKTLIIAILTPLIGMILLLVKNGVWFDEVSFLSFIDNDEFYYYKMIEAMVDFGHPLGYFGYNGSHSLYGNLGVWHFTVLLPYVVWGKLFGWTFSSPMIFHCVLWTLAFILINITLKPSLKQQILISACFIAYGFETRYMFHMLPEAMTCALVVVYCTFLFKMYIDDLVNIKLFWANIFLLMFIVSMRGYYLAYALVLVVILIKKRRYILCAIQIIDMILSVGLYVLINKFFTAEYFWPTNSLEWAHGFSTLVKTIKVGYVDIWHFVCNEVRAPMGSIGYAFYLLIGVLLLINFIKRKRLEEIAIVLSWLSTSIAIILLYNVPQGERMVIAPSIAVFIFWMMSNTNIIAKIIVIFITTCYTWMASNMTLPLAKDVVIDESASDLFNNSMEYGDSEWDNTVLWSLGTSFYELYALPSGYGINCCTDDYIFENIDNLQAKYVTANSESELYKALLDKGYLEVVTYKNIAIFQTR